MKVAAVVVLMLVSSCGVIGGRQARCDLRPASSQCTDWRNSLQPVFTTQEALCKTLGAAGAGGTFTNGQTCSTTEMWGGCQVRAADGSLQTNWYYQGMEYKTKADAQKECTNSMQWVEPS